VADDGQMELPPDPRVLGWYRFGPAPQEDEGGSIVIAGHLDSNRFGLGPLVRLRDVQPGDMIDVRVQGGRTVVYEVRDLRRFDRQALPASIFARSGPELLRLVTCGGAYDADAGGYQKNLVVTAVPV
jgi:sortase (surface protein transpeptidase)